MRRFVLLGILSATVGLSFAGSTLKTRVIFSVRNHKTSDPAFAADGRRLYYWQDSTALYMFDRASERLSRVLDGITGAEPILAVSPAGDRLAFARRAEGGSVPQLWTVSLDPATGLTSGEPRRASVLPAARSLTFSPDGKSIAFATPTSETVANLVVVSANGGPEHLVVTTEGDVQPIVWAKTDSIYFGLSFLNKVDSSKNGVYRVNVAGGTPELVLHTADWGSYPGLSPDGRFILGYKRAWDTLMVTSASGRRLDAFPVDVGDAPATPDVWSTVGKAIGSRPKAIRTVRVVDLATGRQRTLSDSAEFFDPALSPDGGRLAASSMRAHALLLADLRSGARRSIYLQWVPYPFEPLHWSPDGRFIAYHDARFGIGLVDPATSSVRLLSPRRGPGPWLRWRSDSHAIIYAVEDLPKHRDTVEIAVHEVTLDGQDRVLHSFKARCSGGGPCGKVIDDSLVSTWTYTDGEYRVTNFRSRGEPRLIYKRDGLHAPPVPTFSANGRWMAVRRQSSTDQSWSIEVMHPDGSAHRSIPLSFAATSGGLNPWIADDLSELIVASGGCPENQRIGCTDSLTYYRVGVSTGKVTATGLPHTTRPANGMISNDGRTLAYLYDVETRVDFYEFDFTNLLKVAQR